MERVDDVGILRVDVHAAVVAALAVGDPLVVGGDVAPRRAAIVGAIQSEVADEIDALRVGADRDRDGDATGETWEPATEDLVPRETTVRRFVEPRARACRVRDGPLAGPWRDVVQVRSGEDDVGRICRTREGRDAGLIVDV